MKRYAIVTWGMLPGISLLFVGITLFGAACGWSHLVLSALHIVQLALGAWFLWRIRDEVRKEG